MPATCTRASSSSIPSTTLKLDLENERTNEGTNVSKSFPSSRCAPSTRGEDRAAYECTRAVGRRVRLNPYVNVSVNPPRESHRARIVVEVIAGGEKEKEGEREEERKRVDRYLHMARETRLSSVTSRPSRTKRARAIKGHDGQNAISISARDPMKPKDNRTPCGTWATAAEGRT